MDAEYEQLKIAVEALCNELGITASDIRSIAHNADYEDTHIGAKITVGTAHKLLEAGILQ